MQTRSQKTQLESQLEAARCSSVELQLRIASLDSSLRDSRNQFSAQQTQIAQLQSQLQTNSCSMGARQSLQHANEKQLQASAPASAAAQSSAAPSAVSFGGGLRKGDQADCLDTENSWRLVEVLDTDSDRAFVHYIGWSRSRDEWIRKDSARLQPPRTHTRGYTGRQGSSPFHGQVLLDSGATDHNCNDRRLFRKLAHATPLSIVGFSGESITAYEKGEVALVLQGGGTLVLTDVYFSPRFKDTLVSVPRLTSAGYDVAFNEQRATLKKGDTVCEVSRRVNKYLFDIFLPTL